MNSVPLPPRRSLESPPPVALPADLAAWDDAFTRAAQSSLQSPSLRSSDALAQRLLAKAAADTPAVSTGSTTGARVVSLPRALTHQARPLAFAAVFVVALGIVSAFAIQPGWLMGSGPIGRLAYRSSLGLVVADAALSAGQQLDLNADTALHLDDTRVTSLLRGDSSMRLENAEAVTLTQGAGIFRVVPKSGPFAVHAGDVTVRVLGTRFGVERQINGQIDVTVYEGEVQVQTPSGSTSLREGETWNAKDGRRTLGTTDLPTWAQQLLGDWNAANWAMSFPSAASKSGQGVTP